MSEGRIWVATLPAKVVTDEGVVGVEAAGRRLALYAVDERFYATSDLCTHGQARLSDGYLEGHVIECPLHQGSFDVRDGSVIGAPCKIAVRSLPVRINAGLIEVAIDD